MKRGGFWGWFWVLLGTVYFLLPLLGAFTFSLEMRRGVLSFTAYQRAFADPEFWKTFLFSNEMALLTIFVSLALIVPTAFWVHLRVPGWRPVIEFITLMPFVIPAIILVFGLINLYKSPIVIGGVTLMSAPTNSVVGTNALLVAGYVVLAMPYMYRAVDAGLRAIDVRNLTEAAQSLGAGWFTIIVQVILPNLRAALLSGALLTFAIVVGELTLASFLDRPAFGPYLWLLGQHRAYEPAALSIISFGLTWIAMGMIYLVSRGRGGQSQVAGAR
jgi:putative spermidine/putrescine transport system permease protein